MIIINGPTGSGKSSIVKELLKDDFELIPVYSTRPKREDDFDTKHVSEYKAHQMLNNLRILSQISYQAKFGYCKYFILEKSFLMDLTYKVLIGNAQFTPDITNYMEKIHNPLFKVYLDTPYDLIIERDKKRINKRDFWKRIKTIIKHPFTKTEEVPPEILDRIDRLNRDKDQMELLKSKSDLIVCEELCTIYNPKQLKGYILKEYENFLKDYYNEQ